MRVTMLPRPALLARHSLPLHLFVLTALFVCLIGNAQDKPLAFKGATVITISGAPIENGVFIVQGGKIMVVGPADTAIPAGAELRDLTGKVILPGGVDTHSHIETDGGADQSGPIQPDVRILDSINPRGPGIQRAQAGGITTVNIMPGSGHLISGQTIYLKLRDGNTIEDL